MTSYCYEHYNDANFFIMLHTRFFLFLLLYSIFCLVYYQISISIDLNFIFCCGPCETVYLTSPFHYCVCENKNRPHLVRCLFFSLEKSNLCAATKCKFHQSLSHAASRYFACDAGWIMQLIN